MPTNHLIIGLGGTGGKVIRCFRMRIFESFRSEDPVGPNVRYLYVDSSDEMMAHDDPTWKILGQSVQLRKTSQLHIQGLNLMQVLDSLGSYPGISPWIGSKEQFRNILNSANAANVVGGQKRRLGRFLFAGLAHKYREQVQALVKEMETGGTAATTFHVCCGLAGGTGSGSIVDAVSQIRMMFPGKQYRIIIYAQLPDKFPAPNRAGANYHANGYAALRELNALSTGVYQPFDVTGMRPGRQELQDPFNCCYLYTDENEDHNRVDIDSELPEVVASFLYEKIVTNERVAWNALRRMETFENMDFRPEESPSERRPERSRLFFGFGVKRIAYPEEEIREYMTYTFARQAALQLMFNRWSDDFGYLDEPTNQSFSEFVRQKDTLERWYLSDERLQLSEGILQDEIKSKRWKPIAQFWMDLVPNLKTHVRETHARNEAVWMDELNKLCETSFVQNYRDLGVRKFYDTKRGEQKDHVRELRGRIERDLFQEWQTGVKSMYDIARLIAALIVSLEERLAGIDERIAKAKDNEVVAAGKMAANVKEWIKLGPLSRALGKNNSIFDAQGEVLQQIYILRTRIEALGFQKRLLQALTAEISTLAVEVGRANSMLVDSLKVFADSINERCVDVGQADLQKHVVRFYKPDVIKEFARALVLDKESQQKQTSSVRSEIGRLLGEAAGFALFNSKLSKQRLVGVFEETCERMAIESHHNLISADPNRSRILGVSVIDRMQKEYEGNSESLRTYAINVVSRAKNYLCFNEAEVKRQGAGLNPSGFVSNLSIILPEAKELNEFRSQVASELTNATPGAKEVVSTSDRPNEITLVSITNLFPVRFAADVSFLREKYVLRMSGSDSADARVELHSEGDGTQLPDLFLEDINPNKVLAFYMLAHAMECARILEDPDTGVTSLYLVARDEKGRDLEPLLLGKDLRSAVAEASSTTYDSVSSCVKRLLQTQYLHRTKRDEILRNIESVIDGIRAETKNPLDKTYKAYVQARTLAEETLASL